MTTHWYKEPWAWFVFILPMTAVVAGITTFIIANTDADTLVADDYYQKGKAINMETSKLKLAQKLGMKFDLKAIDDEIVIVPTGIEKIFPMLNVDFFHPTLADRDFSLSLTADANGHYRQFLPINITGKWKVTISDYKHQWKLQQYINLPQSNFISLSAESSSY